MSIPSGQPERIAARIDPAVGIDPITIISIIGVLVNVFVNCWRANHPNAEQARNALLAEYAQRPKRLLRRATRAAKRESHVPLTDEQAEAIARATLEEAMAEQDRGELLMTIRTAPEVAFAKEGPLDDQSDD